jgi:hypothetical protein
MLADPKLTADRDNKFNLNIYTGGSLALSAITLIISFIIPLLKNNISIFDFLIVGSFSIAPGITALGERFIYGLPEDSESCLKNLKPWSVSADACNY